MTPVLQQKITAPADLEVIDEKADLSIHDDVEIKNPVVTSSEIAYKVRSYNSICVFHLYT